MADNQKRRVHTTFRLDEDKLKEFKIILLKRDETAQEVIERFVLNYIEKHKELIHH